LKQKQFLDVVDDETAHQLLEQAFSHLMPSEVTCPLDDSWNRVLARDVRAQVDVPGFDRSNMDGFAIRARDSFGAEETHPMRLLVDAGQAIAAGSTAARPLTTLAEGHAISIATGGVIPRGADAVLMVEDSVPVKGEDVIEIFRAISPGTNLTGAGSDIGQGEVVLHRGTRLGSRETALLAAVGVKDVEVYRIPKVAVLSTGDEVKSPGSTLQVGEIFDSNSRIICDAVTELGGDSTFLGICPDDKKFLHEKLGTALGNESDFDMVILSGGTSKGKGDLNYEVIAELAGTIEGSKGIIIHGVSLKPGKPICVAEIGSKPVAVLPGFPTSAIFTFHEFLAPMICRLSGVKRDPARQTEAIAPITIRSVPGRTEYLLVDLVPGKGKPAAFPLGAGSGSVSTFSRADGYIRIPRHQERIDEGEELSVRLIGTSREPADLVAIGSHCVGLDLLLSHLAGQGFRTKSVLVGSLAGLRAQAQGVGDICGCHLLNEETGQYNVDFIPKASHVLGGYGRQQGIVFRSDDERFSGKSVDEIASVIKQDGVRMVNRNRGSGTRVLLDRLLSGATPEGFHSEAKSHHAVAAAVSQGRADWGMTLDILAKNHALAFEFVQIENFDIVVNEASVERPALKALGELLNDSTVKNELKALGLIVD
jgi:putative molybdopterin biosynthesis protein